MNAMQSSLCHMLFNSVVPRTLGSVFCRMLFKSVVTSIDEYDYQAIFDSFGFNCH